MKNKIHYIFFRYFISIIAYLGNLKLFYFIFTPLTIYFSYFLLSLFFDTSLINSTININGLEITLINACIAGSAYYLLFIFNLSTPNIKIEKRLLSLVFSFSLLLIFNVFRIFFLAILFIQNCFYFNIVHSIFWHLISGLLVILIWFFQIYIFKIKTIPFYSDLKFLYKLSFNKK